METVASGDEIAIERTRVAIFFETDFRMGKRARALKIVDAGVRDFEMDRRSGVETGLRKIFHDFVLSVDGDAFSSGEVREIDVVRAAVKAEIDAVMNQADLIETRAEAEAVQEVDRSLLEHAGTNAFFDVLAATIFDDHGIDAFALEKMR